MRENFALLQDLLFPCAHLEVLSRPNAGQDEDLWGVERARGQHHLPAGLGDANLAGNVMCISFLVREM